MPATSSLYPRYPIRRNHKNWANLQLHYNIGYVQYAAPITVDAEGGTLYIWDWAAFLAAKTKVANEFEGSVVDLGTFRLTLLIFSASNANNSRLKYSPLELSYSVPWVVVRSRSSFPRRESSGSRVVPQKRTSPTLQNLTAKASAALSSERRQQHRAHHRKLRRPRVIHSQPSRPRLC